MDICKNTPLEDAPNNHGFSEVSDVCCSHSTSTSGRTFFSQSNQACCEEGTNLCNSPKGVVANKVLAIVKPHINFFYE